MTWLGDLKMFEEITLNNLPKIQEQVLSVIKSDYDINQTIFDFPNDWQKYLQLPSIKEVLELLNLTEITEKVAVNITNQWTSYIHIDHGGFRYSLNIPILNTKNTFLNFFDVKENVPPEGRMTIVGRKKYYIFNDDDVILSKRFETISPYFLDTSVPHSFESHNPNPRIMLLIRLKEKYK